jgi:hypothetical protein
MLWSVFAKQGDLILLLYDIVRLHPEQGCAYAIAKEEHAEAILAYTIAANATDETLIIR